MHQVLTLASPEMRLAPAAFRTAMRIASDNWDAGSITFVMPGGGEFRVAGASDGPHARLIIKDFNFVRRVLAGGDVGFGEGFMAGEWDTPDLSPFWRLSPPISTGCRAWWKAIPWCVSST